MIMVKERFGAPKRDASPHPPLEGALERPPCDGLYGEGGPAVSEAGPASAREGGAAAAGRASRS